MRRYDDYSIFILLFFFSLIPSYFVAEVGTITSGQSLWWMTKRIGQSADIIESCVDELSLGGETVITSADISGGTITLSSSGNYCLASDVTADFSITSTGVVLDLNGHCVTGEMDIGPLGADIVVFNGSIQPPAPSQIGTPNPGIDINEVTSRVKLVDLTVECADFSLDDALGRVAIQVQGDEAQLIRCKVTGGAAGTQTDDAQDGLVGGDGIEIAATAANTIVRSCTIVDTGRGGNVAGSSSGNTGGVGGHGIHVSGAATGTEIARCLVLSTGDGGNSSSDTTGPNGGSGIFINSAAIDASAHDCVIRNTGVGGQGFTQGTAGSGIRDEVVAAGSLSVIFRNVAYDVAGTAFFLNNSPGPSVSPANPPISGAFVRNDFVNVQIV